MATMDMIKAAGGEPANFLDIGGGATPERVGKAFRLVLSDANVQGILVNIFAGINRCDWVAEGVVQALEKNPVNIPVVVRLAGTNVEEGRKILARSGLPIIRASTLAEAAQRAVAHGGTMREGERVALRQSAPGSSQPRYQQAILTILVDRSIRVIVQGITGKIGAFHTQEMIDYGTNIVGGVTPGKSGTKQGGVPVFDTVKQAVEETDATASVVFVPPPFAADAIMEAADAGIRVCASPSPTVSRRRT